MKTSTTVTTVNTNLTTQENNMITLENIELLAATITTPATIAIETATLPATQDRALRTKVMTHMVHNMDFTTKQAIIGAASFTQAFTNICYGADDLWVEEIVSYADSGVITIDGEAEAVSGQPIIEALVSGNFIVETPVNEMGGIYALGSAVHDALNEDKKLHAPTLASEGITRIRDYGNVKNDNLSPLVIEAIEILEKTESVKSDYMVDIANQVFSQDHVDSAEQYVIDGCNKLVSGTPYVTEFMADKRFRLYQAACHGYNGQSSDMARSFQDLANVSTDYDVQATISLLMEEIEDMTSLKGDALHAAIAFSAANPVRAITKCLVTDTQIKKPWNFVKFAKIITQLLAGNTPYIGVAVGFDAKCSGPQLGALMTNSQPLLEATGFSANAANVDDAYEIAIRACVKAGLNKLTRNAMKKPFMAIFYGAGKDAMMDIETIEVEAHNTLYGTEFAPCSEVAKTFHDTVSKSFGPALHALRMNIAGAAKLNDELILDDKIIHMMSDGAMVEMDYRIVKDINGVVLDTKGQHVPNATVTVMNHTEVMMKPTFRQKEVNFARFSQTGFVNMIQASDALVARLIIKNCNELGAQHIVAIHDCFRVNIHDVAILTQAIKDTYAELFGTMKDEPTKNLPYSKDIVAEYFAAVRRASKGGRNAKASGGQFNANGFRTLRNIKGKPLSKLIAKIGTDSDSTSYFAK